MHQLDSLLAGEWRCGRGAPGAQSLLVNPATEEPLARADPGGHDLGAALDFARRQGAALRALTFAERGELLRALSRAIHAHRDELIELAIANGGNTRSDAKFDVDGAAGTLAAYADLGAELGSARLLSDGEAVQLARGPRLAGRHVWVARRGVAVLVNAFNFPAWGLGEKAAAALLAGMPVLCKPATATALVTWRMAKIIHDEKILPAGALSLLAGEPADLIDQLRDQDVLAFTGSSETGRALRSHRAVLDQGVRVNVEADSLNAAVLGPDVAAGSELWELFVNDVLRDMTQKAGQKCTAIRRVYVPAPLVETVLEALRDRLEVVRVGDPAIDGVAMGPLATARQRDAVRDGVGRLSAAARVVFEGSPAKIETSAPGKGFFAGPILLAGLSPSADDAVHRHEVFGPVATVMPYGGGAEQAAELVGWGRGGLVSSLYSDDRAFVEGAVLAMAPFHGRLTIGSTKVAGQAVPPGTVLPLLVHGGPGRAGGGEELGGRRGLALYMQRTAIQGDRGLVEGLGR